MLFMVFALTRTCDRFRALASIPDAVRITAAALVFGIGAIASFLPVLGGLGPRPLAVLRLGGVALACLLISGPVLLKTKAFTAAECAAVLGAMLPRRGERAYTSTPSTEA